MANTSICRRTVASASVALFTIISLTLSAQGTRPADSGWQPLFDGKALGSWQPSKFGGDGAVRAENGQIVLDTGKPFTGVTWSGPELPTTNYEIALQAMRIDGRDFFAGITFPVGDSFCSLILGGWGGTVIGLSSVNGEDASQNQTSQSMEFEQGRWYNVRIRVTDAAIETWLDDKQIIKQDRKGNKISIRVDMDPSLPFGIASYRTKAALRDLRLRKL
jgi:3-keto-disaccharide hydrolase